MNRPRKFFGWEDGGKFKVSLLPRAENGPANVYASKELAIQGAIVDRSDRANGAPTIEWEGENNG